jgi:hypothetical protein
MRTIRGSLRTTAARVTLTAVAALGLSVAAPAASQAAGASTYGFVCNGSYNWVRENWPNIKADTSTNINVYFKTDLYRWNGASWVRVSVGPWYNGVSNSQGRKSLGTFGGLPYYFVTMSGGIPPQLGATYTNLTDGYYAVYEYYQAGSQTWSNWSVVNGTTSTYCAI